MARESMPSAWIRSSSSGIRLAPSRREYSLCVWRWTNAIRLGEDIGARAHCQNRAAPDILRPMRGLASLFALGLMMALFHRVTAGAALEARATLALGFLLLAAFVSSDLARRARLPRITGYLLVGFAVGPAWLGLVRRDEVDALRFIGDVPLGVLRPRPRPWRWACSASSKPAAPSGRPSWPSRCSRTWPRRSCSRCCSPPARRSPARARCARPSPAARC